MDEVECLKIGSNYYYKIFVTTFNEANWSKLHVEEKCHDYKILMK